MIYNNYYVTYLLPQILNTVCDGKTYLASCYDNTCNVMNMLNTISTFNLTVVLSHQGRGLPLAMTPSPDLLCPYLGSVLLEWFNSNDNISTVSKEQQRRLDACYYVNELLMI